MRFFSLPLFTSFQENELVACHLQRSLTRLFLSFFFKRHYFEINLDSNAVLRNNSNKSQEPFTQFPPIRTSCKTIEQYYNQTIDIQRAKIQNIFITTSLSCFTFKDTATSVILPDSP